jgi:cytochrome c nitrite reductase small subunit
MIARRGSATLFTCIQSYSRHVRTIAGLALLAAALGGTVLGLGVFTFSYGEGLSYFSTDPLACRNCHVMNEQYASWSRGPHHAAARCVDCHLPHEFVPKYLAKADNGYRHSKGFTFMDFHEPIMITSRNAATLQKNCVNCHADFVHDIVRGSVTREDAVKCVHCHRGAGHGARS